MMKKICFLLFFLLLASSAFALDVPKPIGFVNDYAGVLFESGWYAKINDLIGEIRTNTTVEIAIVTIPSLEGEDIFSFTLKLAREWGVGKKNNNGLVFLTAMEDKKNRFEVGKGLEGTLPDILTDDLRTQFITPYFRAKRYGEGIYLMLEEVDKILKNDPSVIAKYSERNSFARKYEGLFGIFLFFYFLIFSSIVFNSVKNKTKKYSYITGINILGITIGVILGLGLFLSILLAVFSFIASLRAKGFQSSGRGLGGFGGGSFGGSSGGFGGGSFGGGGSSGGW